MNRTKIIVTYGPSIQNAKILEKIFPYVDVIRINLSHGNKKSWLSSTNEVIHTSNKLRRKILLLADLPGPKIRISQLLKPIPVKKNSKVVFSGTFGRYKDAVCVNYKDLHKDARPGIIMSLGDGYLKFVVNNVNEDKVTCTALNSGDIESGKGVSFYGADISAEVPTPEDVELAQFALSNNFDWLGESFVRSANDIKTLRNSCKGAFIVAKIERQRALNDINAIARESDAIMVARGDLAFDIGIEKVPVAQMEILKASHKARKPVIVATQMLASMVDNDSPTRAEVNDIANAVVNGANYVMLSDETAVGKYPIEAVKILYETIHDVESFIGKKR